MAKESRSWETNHPRPCTAQTPTQQGATCSRAAEATAGAGRWWRVVTCGHFTAEHGHTASCTVTHDHPWLCPVVSGHGWPPAAVHSGAWWYLAVCGHGWCRLVLHHHTLSCTVASGQVWSSVVTSRAASLCPQLAPPAPACNVTGDQKRVLAFRGAALEPGLAIHRGDLRSPPRSPRLTDGCLKDANYGCSRER